MLGTGLGASDEERIGLEVTGQLSRRDYGMRFNAALGSGNAVVADKVKLGSTSPRRSRTERRPTIRYPAYSRAEPKVSRQPQCTETNAIDYERERYGDNNHRRHNMSRGIGTRWSRSAQAT